MKSYSFVRKILDHKFSWTEDFAQTGEDITDFCLHLRSITRLTGLESFVRFTESRLGNLDVADRTAVAGGYGLGTTSLIAGITLGGSPFYVIAAGSYALSFMHHLNSGKRSQHTHYPTTLNTP